MDGRGFEESVRSHADGTKLEAGGASLPRKRADGKRACWSNGRNECRRSGSSLGRRLAAWRCYEIGTKLEAGGASLPRKRADGKRACWSNGRNECRRSGSSLGRRLAAWRCYVRKGSYTGSVV